MNRAIFQGIAAAEASGASGQKKVLKRHMGKGPGVAQGLSPGQRVFLLSSSAREGRHFAACQLGFYPAPAATGTLRISGVHKALLASSPFLHPTMLVFLKMGNFLLEASVGSQRRC